MNLLKLKRGFSFDEFATTPLKHYSLRWICDKNCVNIFDIPFSVLFILCHMIRREASNVLAAYSFHREK